MRSQSRILGFATTLLLSAATALAQAASGGQAAPPAQGRGGAPTPASCGPNPPAGMKNVARDSRCFELRTYTVRAEGPGSPDLLHARFREHTNGFFRKHGMEIVGFWQPLSKPDTLIYLLAYKDAAARDAAWKAFQSDPQWIKVRGEMQVGVQVQSEFMISTDYGPLK
jgi:hypothetical protein